MKVYDNYKMILLVERSIKSLLIICLSTVIAASVFSNFSNAQSDPSALPLSINVVGRISVGNLMGSGLNTIVVGFFWTVFWPFKVSETDLKPESLDGVVLLNSPDVEISKYINLSQFKGFWIGKLINAEKVHPYGENEDITQTVRNECLNKKGIYQFDCISEVDIGYHNVTKITKLENEQYIELNFSNILRLEVNINTLNYNLNAYAIGILGDRTPATAYLLTDKNRIGKYYLAIGNKFATTLYRVIDDNTLENITYRSEQMFSSKTNYFPAHRYVHILSK